MTPQKLHALFGMALSGLTYAEVIASSGTDNDWYDKGKRGVFALVYGGDWNTLVQKLGVTEARAKAAYADFVKRYPGIGKARSKTFDAFCSMRQPAGIGSAVVWAEPAEYIETFLGFRRYFTLENKICKALFDLARNVPQHWRDVQGQGGAAGSRADGRRGRVVTPSTVPLSRCRPPTCGRPRTTKSRALVPRSRSRSSGGCGTCSLRASIR